MELEDLQKLTKNSNISIQCKCRDSCQYPYEVYVEIEGGLNNA